jgi:hypothetical protein
VSNTHCSQPARRDLGVVVEHDQHLAARRVGAMVAAADEAEVLRVAHHAHALDAGQEPGPPGWRGVVDHDELDSDRSVCSPRLLRQLKV